MAIGSYSVVRLQMTVESGSYDFTDGYIVVHHRQGEPDAYASKPYQTRTEAQERADKMQSKVNPKRKKG